jgi:hypothetical protein
VRLREDRVARIAAAAAAAPDEGWFPRCSDSGDGADRDLCASRAAAVLDLLQHVVGRKAFCAALGDLAASGRGAAVGLDDVVSAFERASGRQLAWFFDEWVSRGDLPDYGLDYEISQSDAGFVISGTITQTGELHRTPVPLTLDLGGFAYEEWIEISSSCEAFEIVLGFEPIHVFIDGRALIPRARVEPLDAP